MARVRQATQNEFSRAKISFEIFSSTTFDNR
jgi:hypothetical protein